MSIWRRLKNLWYLSGINWHIGSPPKKEGKYGGKSERGEHLATIVDTENILDKIDIS